MMLCNDPALERILALELERLGLSPRPRREPRQPAPARSAPRGYDWIKTNRVMGFAGWSRVVPGRYRSIIGYEVFKEKKRHWRWHEISTGRISKHIFARREVAQVAAWKYWEAVTGYRKGRTPIEPDAPVDKTSPEM